MTALLVIGILVFLAAAISKMYALCYTGPLAMNRRSSKKAKVHVQTHYGVFDVVIEKDGKEYLVSVPRYPEVVTFGKSLAHAKRMAKEAIEVSVEGDILMRAKRTGDIKLVRTPVRLA